MNYDLIQKNVYYDAPNEYPHSSRNHFEDFENYHIPLTRLHHSTVHDRGVALGVEVSGAPGDTQVSINPGVCVDGVGEMIVLSTSGHGDIGADPPNGLNNEVPVPVLLPLSVTGQKSYVTIQFSEINRVNQGSGGHMEQVPWVRLQPVTGVGAYVDDGTSVILAIVNVSAAGTLTSLAESDGALPYRRSTLGEPVSELRVRRSLTAANQVQETLSGRVTAGAAGGLQVTVPNSGDAIVFSKDGGTNLARVETHADTVVCKDGAGRPAMNLDSNHAVLSVGTQGNGGDFLCFDANGHLGLAYDGDQYRLDIGTTGNGGHLYMRNANAGLTMHLDGQASAVNANNLNPFGQQVIDVGARFFRIHGWDLVLDGRSGKNNRALVNWTNDKLAINFAGDYTNGVEVMGSGLQVDGILTDGTGTPLMGNPARKVTTSFALGLNGNNQVMVIDLGSPKQFTAFGAYTLIDSITDFDSDNAVFIDIFAVDGVETGASIFDNGNKLGPPGDPRNVHAPVVTGVGQKITFRVCAIGPDIGFAALGIVFFE